MISVCLPVYASPIVWLAMESLCNQKTNCKWELVVEEDEQYPMGEKFYCSYLLRLVKAGCIDIKYKYSEKRISLAEKWRSMAKDCNRNSIGILLQGADNYSSTNRIEKAAELFHNGADWIYSNKVIFYHVKKNKTLLYYCPGIGIGSDMGMRTELARQLPKEIKWSSVDTWLLNSLKQIKSDLEIVEYTFKDCPTGIATDGANRISLNRHKMFDNPVPPFYQTRYKLSDCLPKEIIILLYEYFAKIR